MAEKGKAYSKMLLTKPLQKTVLPRKAATLLSKIHPTDDPKAMSGCDLVIEAVSEDPVL
ncbi:MAG: 3-hydroxyacyl-CoA dehydrogenase NAD-binding domain-containing protein [Saprospiraceae bacterium]